MLFYVVLPIAILLFGLGYIGKKYNKTDWGNWFTNQVDGWLRFYCLYFHRLGSAKIELPSERSIIIAANHVSALDPFLIIAATDRPIRFMIAKEEYNKPLLRWLFKAAGCIPIDRAGRVDGAFRVALRAIKAGEIVALFPQGGIHSEETPRPRIKQGIVKLSQFSEREILPIRIIGVGAPGTFIKSFFCRGKVSFRVHRPIPSSASQSSQFKKSFADWLMGKVDKIQC